MLEPTRPGGASKNTDHAEPDGDGRLCPQCHASAEQHHSFCPFCGTSLRAAVTGLATRDPFIGAVVAHRYRLLTKVGVGGMGTVYKVEHVRMGKIMAIKLLHGDLSRDETMVHRFTREARAISRLQGPHSVQVFDFGSADGLFYIVMEYLQGRDLGDLLLERTHLSPRRTAWLLRQVAAGVHEAHRLGIVHRDLKPENVFVCARTEHDEEVVKVLDFGLAKLQTRDDSLIRTQRGLIMGTPHYMSPEQIEGFEVGPPSDVYAAAALVYKTLTGVPPFAGANALRVLTAHLDDPIPSIGARMPELAFLQPIFDRALAKDPSQRFASLPELSTAFDVAVDHVPSAAIHMSGPGASPGWLLPEVTVSGELNLATGRDFDRYEIGLKLRRAGSVIVATCLVAVLVWAGVWGVLLGNFYERGVELEPNDALKDANPIRPGRGVLATIGVPPDSVRADRDVYLVRDVDPGRMLSVRVSGVPEIDLIIEIVNEDAHLLFAQNAAAGGYAEELPNFPVTSKDLYVVVREVWRDGVKAKARPDLYYAISLDSRLPLAGEELEPNDRREDASELMGGQAQGVLCSQSDIDYFRLPLVGGLVALRVQTSGVPRTDVRIALLDSLGKVIARADDLGLARGESVLTTLDADQTNQPLFVAVATSRGFNTQHPYTLDVSTERIGVEVAPQAAPR